MAQRYPADGRCTHPRAQARAVCLPKQHVMRQPREAGTTLVELMVVGALLVVVLGAILSLLDTAAHRAPKDQERAHVIREAQVGLARMTRELRQAHQVNGWGPNWMDVNVTITDGNPATEDNHRVLYECHGAPYDADNPSYDRCTRKAAPEGQALPASGEPVISGIVNGEVTTGASRVFTYDSGNPPLFVKARVEVPARGTLSDGAEHDVVFDDGFYMRNLNPGA